MSDAWPEAVCIEITHDNRKTVNQGVKKNGTEAGS